MGSLNYKYAGIGTLLNDNRSYGIVTGTISGLRISNVSGAYFIDNCAALLPYSGCRVRFKDSGGKYFDCLLGLRGVSEETTTGVIAGGDFESGLIGIKGDSSRSVSTWTLNTTNPISGTKDGLLDITTSYNGRPYVTFKTGTAIQGVLYIYSFDYKVNSGSWIFSMFYDGIIGLPIYQTFTGSGSYSKYVTFAGGNESAFLYMYSGNSLANIQFDNCLALKVLTPSNQGLLLQAAPTVDSGFLYNAASYTYEIWS